MPPQCPPPLLSRVLLFRPLHRTSREVERVAGYKLNPHSSTSCVVRHKGRSTVENYNLRKQWVSN